MTERLRGRRGVAQRLRRLRANPLCEDCAARGVTRVATVPDHRVPLAKGGTDTDDNTRNLCADCHRFRTAQQFGHKGGTIRGPDGWPVEP